MNIQATLKFAGDLLKGAIPWRDLKSAKHLLTHRQAARHGSHAFAGEEFKLHNLVERVGLTKGLAVDIAASDGVTQSCTLGFYRDQHWGGLAVECDPEKFTKLAWAYEAFPAVKLAQTFVTPLNVVELLKAFSIPKDFELLNLDIDSYDRPVMQALLDAGFRPKVITMEVNEKLPPPLYFAVNYAPDHGYSGGHFYGCSAEAAAATVRPRGYILESILGNNAFFVQKGLAKKAGMVDRDVAEAYRDGYLEFPDRAKVFYYNHDVDAALSMAPKEALAFFKNYFAKYKGRYELRMAKPSRR